MAKTKTAYQCNQCGGQTVKWAGRCPDCNSWNTLEEIVLRSNVTSAASRFRGFAGAADAARVISLGKIELDDSQRLPSGIAEFDRVLGGGIVPGSVVLIGGDPGIGKSTLLLQLMAALSFGMKCLYVTGEESLQQVALRAQRLGLGFGDLECLTETCVEQILEIAGREQPRFLVIDSIQTLYTDHLQSAPGSVAQVRESAARMVRFAKDGQCAVFLVGHVTKDGTIAGPRVLEHMVDAVLYFESDIGSRYRVIRAVKNRFGAVNELGVFAMTGQGLKEVSNPSAIFMSGHATRRSGSAVLVTREGTRPLLVEVQALVDSSHLANPRRVGVGVDHNRLAMLLAVIHRHAGISLGDQDVFVNVVGGIRINETASDLPILLAIYSSLADKPLPEKTVSFGEIGLSGEVRPVYNAEERLREAAVQGFTSAIVPRANRPRKAINGMEVHVVDTIQQALDTLKES